MHYLWHTYSKVALWSTACNGPPLIPSTELPDRHASLLKIWWRVCNTIGYTIYNGALTTLHTSTLSCPGLYTRHIGPLEPFKGPHVKGIACYLWGWSTYIPGLGLSVHFSRQTGCGLLHRTVLAASLPQVLTSTGPLTWKPCKRFPPFKPSFRVTIKVLLKLPWNANSHASGVGDTGVCWTHLVALLAVLDCSELSLLAHCLSLPPSGDIYLLGPVKLFFSGYPMECNMKRLSERTEKGQIN